MALHNTIISETSFQNTTLKQAFPHVSQFPTTPPQVTSRLCLLPPSNPGRHNQLVLLRTKQPPALPPAARLRQPDRQGH